MLRILTIGFFIGIILASCSMKKEMGSHEILERSIAFHDPTNQWNHLNVQMHFEEVNPKDEIRHTTAWLDQEGSYFKLNRGDNEIHGMILDSCFIEKGAVDCARAMRMRDYYTYLWGLPMKLKDEGTNLLDSVRESSWEGQEVYVISVDYEKDDWQYFIDRSTFQLVGYEFVQPSGNSEKVVLTGVIEYKDMRIPAERSWYMVSDNDRFLGTDKLVKVED